MVYGRFHTLFLVDLDDDSCAAGISSCKTEFTKRVFDRLWDIDCMRLVPIDMLGLSKMARDLCTYHYYELLNDHKNRQIR